jgi:hypothetical protein
MAQWPFRTTEISALSTVPAVGGWASPAHITFAGDRRDWEW